MISAVRTTLFLLLLCVQGVLNAYYAQDFTEAKSIARVIWADHRETFYGGCRYDRQGVVDFKSCHYTPIDPRKSKRISWEHVVPVSWYGNQLSCWKDKPCRSQKGKPLPGRECCRKVNRDFRQMEADLHNLVPAIREINTQRRHYAYAELPYLHKQKVNGFHFYVDEQRQLVEPRKEAKGMAARITLYMSKKYDIKLPEDQRKLLKKWNGRYPPSAWEKRWHSQVSAIQGDINPYIQDYNNNKNRG